ncbi:hypothetical protein [Ralstonia soli]|uniref:Uncharacterized protein n=1 Tax=Ralstonia soli TaxID=2953896 RepID=A0ABT1AH87_9RALS|nr:hypothetical protein [Ralstonia soli]MCO5397769.1 hypothetical protein [Ralstonia soli]
MLVQTLTVTARHGGQRFLAAIGQPAQVIHPGDVVWIALAKRHWHAASEAILPYAGTATAFVEGADTAPFTAAAQRVTIIGAQGAVDDGQQNIAGRVRIDPLYPDPVDIPAAGAYVTFEPGAALPGTRIRRHSSGGDRTC